MYQSERWLDRLQWKYGKYAIRNLMTIIVAGMAIVYILDSMTYTVIHYRVSRYLSFNLQAILHGQIWRLISFIFIPPDSNPLFVIFSLYFYWLIGSSLENQWGSFKFNVYYLCGMIGTIIAGCITGHATNYYLNMSLFLAFAMLYPNYQVVICFILPVKMKHLAMIDAAAMLIMFLRDGLPGKIALVAAIANFILFFWRDIYSRIHAMWRRYKWRRNFK